VTPPGHWNLIAQYVSRRDNHDLDRDVKLYCVLNNALMDCSITAWAVKRYYDSVRPVSAIRFLYAGKEVQAWGGPGLGTRKIDGATWHPYQPATFVTPPFAEFVSGHSTFSRRAAEMLKSFTGSNDYGDSWKQPAGASLIEPGVTPSTPVRLSCETFTEAAEEAGCRGSSAASTSLTATSAGSSSAKKSPSALGARPKLTPMATTNKLTAVLGCFKPNLWSFSPQRRPFPPAATPSHLGE
jgi:hypothetical protein